ncbi:MAG: LysR family transcriptional regulator [Clostridium sp.]
MEFREISTFLQVAQYQSFSKAARHLGYSQAAVTIQIKQLEQELGVHLFDRIGKQISLTHQGQVFYQYAVSIRNDLEQAKNAVADPSTLSGKLCLGTIESICASIFPDLLAEYHLACTRRSPSAS